MSRVRPERQGQAWSQTTADGLATTRESRPAPLADAKQSPAERASDAFESKAERTGAQKRKAASLTTPATPGGASVRGAQAQLKLREIIAKAVSPNLAIRDQDTAVARLAIADSTTVGSLEVDVDIDHPARGQLLVTLVGPSGKRAIISDHTLGATYNIKGTWEVPAFAGEPTNGEWKLEVQDTVAAKTGTLRSFGLRIVPAGMTIPQPVGGADADPMTHITYLAADAMRGRKSPSPEYTAAAAYVEGLAKKYGLLGPNVNNPSAPYLQPVQLYSFTTALCPGHEVDAQPTGRSHVTTFERGFYLDEQMPQETLELINARYEKLMKDAGALATPPLDGHLRSADELKKLARADGSMPNVMGLLPGTGPHKDEVIVVMAHLDHLGTGMSGVFNGADDNASGSGVVLAAMPELAAAQQRGELDRSVLFLWTAAEEQGLVGSTYFVDHPIPGISVDKVAGVLNLDMVSRWDDERISVIDVDKSGKPTYLRDLLATANASMSDPFNTVNRDINQYLNAQDGAAFTRKGKDVLLIFEGEANPSGGGGDNADYHRITDDTEQIIRENGGSKPRRVKDLAIRVVKLAANR